MRVPGAGVRPIVKPALILAAVSLLGACGSDGAAPATTLAPLGPTNYTLQPAVDETTTTTIANALPEETVYTIQSGDYLSKIATQFGVSIDEIVAYNEWTDGQNHVLIPGQDIKIPPGGTLQPPDTTGGDTIVGGLTTEAPSTDDTNAVAAGATYTVEDGDYLAGIAEKFDTTVDAIVAANGWSDGAAHVIWAGMEIKLPA